MTKEFHGWRKSGHSNPDGGCVEAGRAGDGTVGVRDTRLRDSPVVEFSPAEWARLIERVRRGS